MKKRIRISAFLLACLMLLPLNACKPAGDDIPDTEGTEWESSAPGTDAPVIDGPAIFGDGEPYRIVLSASAGDTLKNAAERLKKALSGISGLDFQVVQVTEEDGIRPDGKEIVIGRTHRSGEEETGEIKKEHDYLIRCTGSRIVIAGGSDSVTADAVESFISTFIGDGEKTGAVLPKLVIPREYSFFRSEEDLIKELTYDAGKTYETVGLSLQPGAGNDADFILKNSSGQTSVCRFTDKNAELIYHFDISKWTEPKFVFTLSQNYKAEYSADGVSYTEFANYADLSGTPIRNMDNKKDILLLPQEKGIFFDLYIRFTDNDPSDGHGTAVMNISVNYSKEIKNVKSPYLDGQQIRAAVENLSKAVKPSSVNGYALHSDGGLIYNPISREKSTELNKYDGSEKITGEIRMDDTVLRYEVPKKVTAYDAVPVKYTLFSDRYTSYYVEANAMEEAARSAESGYYDLALPGKVDVDFEYLGYVSAKASLQNRPVLSLGLEKDRVAPVYPNYTTGELTRSGTVRSADYVWFRIRYTNTGSTILDGDGTGTFCFEPLLNKKNPNGVYEQIRTAENLYYRIDDALYPGESGEMWICFNPVGFPEGEYEIRINCIVRNETSNPENYAQKIWGGDTYSASVFDFRVTKDGAQTEPQAFRKIAVKPSATLNTWLHTYEEFMTSYDTWMKTKRDGEYEGTLYLQCAPWTDQVVLKLIRGGKGVIACAYLPVEVETDSIKVAFNPDNDAYTVLPDGTRFPTIQAQSMVDMRGNIQLGPYPEKLIVETLNTMKSIGINTVNTTSAFMFDDTQGAGLNNNVDAFWYSADAARKLGIKMEGFVSYPFGDSASIAGRIAGRSYTGGGFGTANIQITNAVRTLYQFRRWGDNFWMTAGGIVPLSVEDTRGWERVDFNARYPLSASSLSAFRIFLIDLYGSLDALNQAWGTKYKSISDILPEKETTEDHGYRRYYSGKTFREWSRPLADLDAFRTLERAGDYSGMMAEVNKTYPSARLNLRTEGANWIAPVDPSTKNPHLRHVYYSQRRCAIIPELIGACDAVWAHSDYTTLPYTPSEVTELTKASLKCGVHPILLPQFNRMRDIAVNEKYGTDFSHDYNLSGSAKKGAYINTVCSVFEWFKAIYEAGGTPGILWQDYLCDGYATATQKKEIAFFTEKLTEAMNTPEGRKWRTEFTLNDGDLKNTEARYSYDPAFVQKQVDEVLGK